VCKCRTALAHLHTLHTCTLAHLHTRTLAHLHTCTLARAFPHLIKKDAEVPSSRPRQAAPRSSRPTSRQADPAPTRLCLLRYTNLRGKQKGPRSARCPIGHCQGQTSISPFLFPGATERDVRPLPHHPLKDKQPMPTSCPVSHKRPLRAVGLHGFPF